MSDPSSGWNCEDCCDGEELELGSWPSCASCGTHLDGNGNILGPGAIAQVVNAATPVDTDDGGELDELRSLMAAAQLKKNAAGATPEDLLRQLENLEHQADATPDPDEANYHKSASAGGPTGMPVPAQNVISRVNTALVDIHFVQMNDNQGVDVIIGFAADLHSATLLANDAWAQGWEAAEGPLNWVDQYNATNPNYQITIDTGPVLGDPNNNPFQATAVQAAPSYQPIAVVTQAQLEEQQRLMVEADALAALSKKAGRPAGTPIFKRPAAEEDDDA